MHRYEQREKLIIKIRWKVSQPSRNERRNETALYKEIREGEENFKPVCPKK